MKKEGTEQIMKKIVKKLAAVGMSTVSILNLAACGSSSASSEATSEITKPDEFTIMVDNTVLTETNGGQQFYDYLSELTGLTMKWIRPDHTGYYDAVANAFNTDTTMPDVVLLSSDYYALYASNGFLWNMTDAWEKSETKNSGRLISTADNVLSALMVKGEDGTKGMYGFSPFRGNGCCTYVKKAWLDEAGIDVSKVSGVNMDFATYYGYLKQMAQTRGHYVISAPGFVSAKDAPYTNYLPEFYQKANYTFYKDDSGKYVDGFTQKEMEDALQRIQTAVADGVIDKESVNNSTSNARDKFKSTDKGSESGVFTYWAGAWAKQLTQYLKANGLDSELIAINPITELGSYVERVAPAWCITTHAQNPEGIYKYFIDTLLDGSDIQTAWEYGAKGTHWDTKAETVTLQGKEDAGTTYKEGEFHILPSPEQPNTLTNKNHIDPLLALTKYKKTDSNKEGKDPGADILDPLAVSNGAFFADHSEVAEALPMTEVLGENNSDINTARQYVVSQVSLGYMSVDEGMTYYTTTVGTLVDQVLKSLNK